MKKILVLRGGALGDFIITLPALAWLRRRWPDALIELAGNAIAAELARSDGLIDVIHSQHDALWGALVSDEKLPEKLSAWLGTFDAVIQFWPDSDCSIARHFPLRSGQQFITASAHPGTEPASLHFLQALLPLGWNDEGTVLYRFQFTQTILRAPRRIAVHPGSGSAKKNWSLENWSRLCAWLREEQQAELFIITGEAEPAGLLEEHGTALRQLPLPQLATHLAGCGLFIGHDSGISHLAAASGTPCLLLFGPTEPARWAPPAPHVQVLRAGQSLAEIALPAVQQAVRAIRPDQS